MDPEEADDEFETEDFEELDEGLEPEEQQGEEPQEPEEGAVEDQPPARKSRAQTRIETLDREVREARERAEAAERRLSELSNGSSRAEAERQAAERQRQLDAMDPWDRAQAEARDSEARTRGEMQAIRREIADSKDQASFAAVCAANPAVAKVKDQVEAQLREARGRGVDVPRETLAAYIIGQQVLDKATKAKASAARKAAANIDRERTRAPSGGASEAPSRGREPNDKAARDKRLESYRF